MNFLTRITSVFLLTSTFGLQAQVAQIDIPRVELMPNQPSPYNVRDWEWVAERYDSFVYDLNKTGQYLPFVHLSGPGINYPNLQTFGLHTYVGTNSPQGNEAINVLPSLVGATLNGIDKSNQFGRNWVLASQDFFNLANGELIYLNNRSGGSGGDWWYDMMPNIYFYQLYDLYPDLGGDEDFQFTSVADRFLQSVRAMGAGATPWQKPDMNHRAWNFKTMQPNDNGVKEPEAAGAYAWVLYNAYRQTGNPAYLQGAEWSMEFLSEWMSNPSYELQLPYGTYTAARMNAELGTAYDVEKMVNWSFNRGPLRGWGTIVGTWGGFDVSGVVGEANDNGNDYAFQMNGVQQAAALVPMVRYDKRFARAIGKWVLNLANATRLFFPGFLPASHQDATAWSNQYDPDRVIGYEALREQWQGLSPFSTGDAAQAGWAATNLALYGTSSIGYLGAIVEKTNVDKILRLDLLKTDFFGDTAYPTYLLYNPFAQSKAVEIELGATPTDVYDALTETFLVENASGTVNISIPADQAVLIALTPAGGAVTYDLNRMLVNGVVVDYRQSAQSFTYPPRLKALAAAQSEVEFGDSTAVYAAVSDADSQNFTWSWSATGGTITGAGPTVQWHAPSGAGTFEVTVIVTDEGGKADTATISIAAVAEINQAPVLDAIVKSAAFVAPGGTVALSAPATDPNGDPLTFAWTSSGGTLAPDGNSADWTAPLAEGIYQVTVTVTDDGGLTAQVSTTILVKDFTAVPGTLLAHYPLNGNANDVSGNNLHGTVSGALFVNDFWGNAASALQFDGVNDRVTVANSPLLNNQQAISVSAWLSPRALPDHEVFLLSHGSWQNRWKISITPEKKVRWTVNTLSAVADLDLDVPVAIDSVYHVVATYDGELLALYLNGVLRSYKPFSGLIRTTTLPLLFAQMLPDNTEYNFKGVLDDVRLYDYPLTPDEVAVVYADVPVAVHTPATPALTLTVWPNPVRELALVHLSEPVTGRAQLMVYDAAGRLVEALEVNADSIVLLDSKSWKPGLYQVELRARSASGRTVLGKL
jgi:hypothetical protein